MRFDQEHFKIYVNIQEILLNSFASERRDTELAEVVKLDSFELNFATDGRVNGV